MLALNPPYKFKWTEKTVPVVEGIDNDIYSTVDACPNACEMWKSIERSQLAATKNRGREIVNSPPSTYDQEPTMAAEDGKMSKEKEIDKLMALISLSFKKIYKSTNNNLRTSSNTSRANQDNTLRINRGTRYENQRVVNVARARENVGVISTTSVSRPQLMSNHSEDKVLPNNSQGKKQVEYHHRNFKFSNNKTSVTATKMPMALPISSREPKQTVNQSAVTPRKRTVAAKSTNQKPRSTIRKQYEQISKTCIEHQTSTAQTPDQNDVVERRNRTLVEAARTMLSAAKAPLFFWDEAIATTCFTQNHSLVIPQHEKTPYDIINGQKPSVKFFHIFGSLWYIVRDGENIDKMKEKDILPLNIQTTSIITNQAPTQVSTITATENINQAETDKENAQVKEDEFINIFSTPVQEQGETSSRYVDSPNMHTFYQRHPLEHHWIKDHPLEQVIGNPSQSIRKRRQLETDGNMCMFSLT
nr:retrovirus-related Pol polyprotein from transposon TNT 1-94 [Tanacetum cinerariifolium]